MTDEPGADSLGARQRVLLCAATPAAVQQRVAADGSARDLHCAIGQPERASWRGCAKRSRRRGGGRTRTPRRPATAARGDAPRSVPPLEFFNGLGGFAAAGREYVTVLDAGQWTPAPWTNVIANPQFGFLVSADGAGSTWSLNAQQNQLTPWSNDPVSNAPAEVIYIRDQQSGDLWSATPLPIREPGPVHIVRHGFGYSRFEHTSHGISLELLQFVPLEDPLKISRLKLCNRCGEERQLSVTHYVEWVLGNLRSRGAPFIVTEIEPQTSALLARNPWSTGFQTRVAFMDMRGRQQACTGDRTEFIGRHGSLAEPAALLGPARLSNRVGGGLDPCGAMQCSISLAPGEETELVFLLGQEASTAEAAALLLRYRCIDLDAVLKVATDFWDETLGTIQVRTPDRSMDVLLNGWLLYQTLACRLWARTAFYQSSGAYGFRDQLQDAMALCVSRPSIAREHILRAASRQFAAGDVQHWWLPGSGQGVKTRVSDDRVWLPYVVSALSRSHARTSACSMNPWAFSRAARWHPTARNSSRLPRSPPTSASLYEHCARALDSSLAVGAHGLPLFGTGDWNDGMNRVGAAWSGRECLARLVPPRDTAQIRAAGRRARRCRQGGAVAQACHGPAAGDRTRILGRRVVSTRLLRRRHSLRIGFER